MKNLVIIGNGFDLFHGIKSSYWDFKEYLEEMGEDEFIRALERYIYSDELWSSFECTLGNMDYEAVEENNSCYLLGYGDENWSDSAHHDYQMMISEELSFSDNISAYIKNWILSLQTIRKKKISTNIINQDNIFISFNYTDTLEQTYNIPRERILYIHGKAKESTELIVGHGDESMITSMIQKDFSTEEEEEAYIEYMEGYDVRELEAEEIIRGYFRSTYKNVNSIIKNNLSFFNKLHKIRRVYIIGHSLADVDLQYFSFLFDYLTEDIDWIVTYHKEYEKRDFITKLLSIGIQRENIYMYRTEQLK